MELMMWIFVAIASSAWGFWVGRSIYAKKLAAAMKMSSGWQEMYEAATMRGEQSADGSANGR